MITLHYHPLSTFSRRVHMTLLEKKVPFELAVIDMRAKEHKSPEYLALNPYGRVPTLVEDGFVLYESTAILDYLEATHPEPALAPRDVRGRALVGMHMKLADVEIGSAVGTLIFPKRFMAREKWDLDAMGKAKTSIQRHLDILGRALEGKTWLVAETYSLADICYTAFAEFFDLMEVTLPPSVAAWTTRLLERPSAVATKPSM